MATIEKPIESMTNEELSNALRIRGVQYGPIVGMARLFYLTNFIIEFNMENLLLWLVCFVLSILL